MNMTDGELLRRYVHDHSDASFEELVKRHIHLIYSAALRQVNGDVHLAEDVTQCVFTDLARKAARLTNHTSLTGWLYTSTRFVAANLRRAELRRGTREKEVHTMNAIFNSPEPEADWVRVWPLLDEAMHTLDAEDRQAVLMRHFENRSYAEIAASFGLTENAARMRVDRALEKLHGTLTKHGVTSTAVALAGLLTVNAVGAAPAHLTAKVVGAALTGAASASGLAVLLSHIFTASKAKMAFGVIAAALVATLAIMVASRHIRTGGSENTVAAVTPTNSSVSISVTNLSATIVPAIANTSPRMTNGLVLHLEIITADTGKPIPMVPIDYRGWAGGKFEGKQLVSDRFGKCDVVYPTNITELELTTRKDYFADTRLLWRPSNGETIPTNYVLRIDRPVPIGGSVVDEDGRPVAGARVGWNHEDDPANLKLPQSHDFTWIETKTDEEGHWQINRIGEDMLNRIYGSAGHSNFIGSALIFFGREKAVDKQLRDSTYVFKLGRAVTASGMVTDTDGTPIPDANILVGTYGMNGSRSGKSQSDGTFSVAGCPPGKQLVTAEAPGFAAASVEVDLADNIMPVHLILKPGKLLRLRVMDKAGNPIPKAYIYHNNFDGVDDPNIPKLVQVEFNEQTDQAGRVALTNAPDVEMTFDVQASGFLRVDGVKIRPDGKEHIITLPQALVVHGVVWDAATGLRIPKFRIAMGRPVWNPMDNTTNAQWSTIGRFWLDFAGGTYRDSFEEGVVGGTKNPGYILKFIADGYAPFISRMIASDEGDVELNVTLHRAVATTVTIRNPDGLPASDADIGLVFPGAKLSLGLGGFSRQNLQTGGSLLRTDANGTFKLQPDDTITRVIAASPAGYVETTPAALSANPALQLQPWGHLEVTCLSQGKPVVGRLFGLRFDEGSAETLSFDWNVFRFTTDAQGQFTVSYVPPGHHNLVRLFPIKISPGGDGWTDGNKIPIDVKSGTTTTLCLGTNNYSVTARLQWPPGMTRKPEWQIMASLHTPMPVVPPEIRTNHAALMALWQTDEFKIARQNSHGYPPTINADDTLSVDEVLPGNYQFTVGVYVSADTNAPQSSVTPGIGPKLIAQGKLNVTVPSDPPTGNLDAGQIELQNVPDPAH
ncbi:MAG: sigma-70 family RNA polymerase sigma factor [Limisphaerales bacterium]